MHSEKPTSLNSIYSFATEGATLVDAIKLALLIGAILNIINQGDALMGNGETRIHWPKLILTFCVPFCVSEYAANRAKMRQSESND